jgi:hypothetical protein
MEFLKLFGAVAVAVLISACGPSYYEQMADLQQKSFDRKMARADENQKQIEALWKVCMVDTQEFWDHPKPPYLKSCLEFQAAMQKGIKDMRARDECHEDMMEEIPSCKKWRRESNYELERLKSEK